MRIAFVTLLLLAARAAHAGPPAISHFEPQAFVAGSGGVWLVGEDSCDEGGSSPRAHWLGPGARPVGVEPAAPTRHHDLLAGMTDRTRLLAAAQRGDVAVAVGKGGWMVATRDGGATWSARSSGTKVDLRSVWLRSATEAYAVGDHGVVLATHDGKTWRMLVTKSDVDLDMVWGIDDDLYALSASAPAIASHDRGKTWQPLEIAPFGGQLIGGISPDRIFVVGWSRLLRSEDRGKTWTELFLMGRPCRGGS